MSFSTLPLSYCTNVHPGQTLAEVAEGLRRHTAAAQQRLGAPIAAGLWLAASVMDELEHKPGSIHILRDALQESGLVCYTLNTFPYGNFHSQRVKENVYVPDWSTEERLDYTLRCAEALTALLPAGIEGSLSTVPLGFKGFEHPSNFQDRCIERLLTLAAELDLLHDDAGLVLRLAIEPEPCCVLETTPETLAFFERLFAAADEQGILAAARRHLGVCYDVCHQAVEFEDVAESIRQLHAADVRINKVHITCALHVERPAERPAALEQLSAFAEPRYLHQTFARGPGGIVHQLDLTKELCQSPPSDFALADAWRVHFHVPVHRQSLGELGTTRPELQAALAAVAALPYAPHLEVETYTWGVLPGEQPETLADGLASELQATLQLLDELRA